ncbi:MAG: DedA family protein [Rhodospirillales bacterium]
MLDRIAAFVGESGYAGIALLMLAENLFPPIPSELIMPMAGYAAARGELNLYLAIAAGTAGSLLGAAFWYGVGWWVGSARLKRWAARHGRLLTVTPEEIDRACAWFDRHGGAAVLVGRVVPGVRTFISVPAGIAAMPAARFAAWTALGTAAWTSALAIAGYVLGEQYGTAARWVDRAAVAVAGLCVAGYAYRVATFGRRAA